MLFKIKTILRQMAIEIIVFILLFVAWCFAAFKVLVQLFDIWLDNQ